MSESLVTVDVGGQSYPYKTEPRCHVCSDNNRLEMETALAQGRAYKRMVELFADSDAVTPRSLQGHLENGHMPVRAAAVQAVAQARSAELTEPSSPSSKRPPLSWHSPTPSLIDSGLACRLLRSSPPSATGSPPRS